MRNNSYLWNLLLNLPQFVKGPLLRAVVGYPTEIPDTLRFKVAQTEDELAQAFTLLHDAYVREGLMEPQPSGMRVTKYHALPSTTTLIALENDVVVGTVSLIRQSSFGMPCRAIFELDDVPPGSRLAEVSALAIRKENLHQRGRILFPLLKFLFHYSYEYFGVSHFVIAVNPKWIDFYKSILDFKPLSNKVVQNYSFVNGAPAAGGILDLTRASERYYKIYGSKRKERNLYTFFRELECKNMEFPLRKKSIITDPMLSPDLLRHFFIDKTDCLSSMTDYEHSILREMYDHSEYLKLIPQGTVVPIRAKRTGKRFEMDLRGRLVTEDKRSIEMVIQDVSLKGIGGYMNPKYVNLHSEVKVLVNIEELNPCELRGHFVRLSEKGQFGFVIAEACPTWKGFVFNLERRMNLAGSSNYGTLAPMVDDIKKAE